MKTIHSKCPHCWKEINITIDYEKSGSVYLSCLHCHKKSEVVSTPELVTLWQGWEGCQGFVMP